MTRTIRSSVKCDNAAVEVKKGKKKPIKTNNKPSTTNTSVDHDLNQFVNSKSPYKCLIDESSPLLCNGCKKQSQR